jgi:hypothetical protein
VIVEERSPGLRGRPAAPDDVFADARLADVDAELEQFAVDMGSTLRVEENSMSCRLSLALSAVSSFVRV